MRSRSLYLGVVVCLVVAPAFGQSLESNHGVLKAVPAKGPIQVDGVLDDAEWDLSGEMFVFGVRKLRERYSVKVYANWNGDSLFLGLKWRDPTPMINNVDADTEPQNGWMSDSFQARFTTDYGQIHFTSWYSSIKDKSVVDIRYDGPLNAAGAFTRLAGGKAMQADGFEMAFKQDADQRGYVQEMRIPWRLLYRNTAVQAGTKFRFSGEYFWGGPSGTKWPAVMWADPVNQANPQRVVLYQSPHNWGECELLPQGNLPRVEEEVSELRLQGPVAIKFAVPADATHFSLTIDDAQGGRVRNLASHQKIADYAVGRDGNERIVQVPWDGRAEGTWKKDRQLFLGDYVAPGSYNAKVLVHRGVGVVHAGSFYNPGTPPWATADMSGDWGFDHSPPTCIAAVGKTCAAPGRVFVGFPGGENGVGMIGLNAEGRKIWSWVRHGVGPHLLAANEQHCIYYAAGGNNQWVVGQANPANGQNAPLTSGAPEFFVEPGATGLALHANTVALAFADLHRVTVFDLANGNKLRDIAVEAPVGLAYSTNGKLVGISGEKLFAVEPNGSESRPLTLQGITEPLALAFDADGTLYVSDRKDSNIKVFATVAENAAPTREIGQRGGHRPGPWNPNRMNTPRSLSVEDRPDGTRQIWACEEAYHPRRVSVWKPTGEFVRDYLGNTNYSGHGGLMSDNDPHVGVFAASGTGLIFNIDYQNYDYQLKEIMGGQPDPQPGKVSLFGIGYGGATSANFGSGYLFRSSVSGKPVEYYVEGFAVPTVYMRRGDRWLCVAALGNASAVSNWPADFPPAPSPHAVFSWNDLNGDGFQQPNEIKWQSYGDNKPGLLRGGWGYQPDRGLTWHHGGYRFAPTWFTDDGAPLYDVTVETRLPGDLFTDQQQRPGEIYKTKFGYVCDTSDGNIVDENNVIHGLHWYTGYDHTGKQRWKFPNYWIAVHGGMTAPMAMPGVIMGSLRITGIAKLNDSHDVIAIRGNMGQEFLLRDDGMYLGELFTDQRMAPSSFPPEENIAGVPINDMTMGGEAFSGWFGRQDDGKVRLTYGNTDVRIAEVVGLDNVIDLPPITVALDDVQLAACRNFVPQKGVAQRITALDVPRGGAIAADVNAFGGPDAAIIRAGREEVGRVMVRYDDANLYVAFQASDGTPWVNGGGVAPLAFKTGDSANVFIAPMRDYADTEIAGTRVLLTELAGKPTSVVFQPQGNGKLFTFESPVRKTAFGYVNEEPRVTFTGHRMPGKAFVVAATIPWAVLGVQPAPGLTLKADFGLLFSDDTGTKTDARVHWSDEQTGVVNDVPTEAEFFPARWGTMTLK